MDANERLRRYLEQRRELGESELVLDGMPVDDVLAMLGAKRGGASRPARPHTEPARGAATPKSAAPSVAASSGDARADARVESTGSHAPVDQAPTPDVRFDASAPTDWREVLRASAGSAPTPTSGEPAPTQSVATPMISGAPVAASQPTSAVSQSTAEAAPTAPLPNWLTALDLPAGLYVAAPEILRTDRASTLPTLDAVADAARACIACALHSTATNAVPGEGNPDADLLCVGEAPGANEDLQGRPFVGETGQLLTKILGAIELQRDDVYICNVLKHRPPGNRDPLPDEVHACQPFLLRQLELVQPRVILALGRFAAQSLLQTSTPIGKLRGQLHRFHGIPLIVTYHPAALLRNEAWKRPTWEDVKLARRVLDASRHESLRVDSGA